MGKFTWKCVKPLLLKYFFLVYTTLHCQSTDRIWIRIHWKKFPDPNRKVRIRNADLESQLSHLLDPDPHSICRSGSGSSMINFSFFHKNISRRKYFNEHIPVWHNYCSSKIKWRWINTVPCTTFPIFSHFFSVLIQNYSNL